MHSDESRNKKWMAYKNRDKQGEFGGQTLPMNDVGYDALAASKLYCNLYTYFVVSKSKGHATTLFKNPHCALCNGVPINETKCYHKGAYSSAIKGIWINSGKSERLFTVVYARLPCWLDGFGPPLCQVYFLSWHFLGLKDNECFVTLHCGRSWHFVCHFDDRVIPGWSWLIHIFSFT